MSDFNPPAFPRLEALDGSLNRYNVVDYRAESSGGMELRDWFAGQALAGGADSFCDAMGPHGPNTDEDLATHAERHAKAAYMLADAMLKERAK